MNIVLRVVNRFEETPVRREVWPIILLAALWALYFWRALTPNPADQVSLPQGDFSGQFLAFGAYQAKRLVAGEIPLWNPYNYAGHPFLADTQAAVFYPPRLITIGISHFFGGWNYTALQFEVIGHYAVASILMYAFVRVTAQSRLAGITSALTWTYGGYLTGYPPLQSAVLEAGIWLPLILLGVYLASTHSEEGKSGWRLRWLGASGLALGISLLAGHPQTSLFMTYVLIAYLANRAAATHLSWKSAVFASAVVLGIGYGLAAVQALPGLEYTALTTRAEIKFDARANGFPYSDFITVFLPNVFTTWSPLYSGIAPLAGAAIAVWGRADRSRFWSLVAVAGLAVSVGGATIVYHLAYLSLPGLSWFRGQERAAYVVAFGVAMLAGLGVKLLEVTEPTHWARKRLWAVILVIAWIVALETRIALAIFDDAPLAALTEATFFLGLLMTLTWLWLRSLSANSLIWQVGLLALIVFDLFSATMATNWEAVPVAQRSLFSDLVPVVQSDTGLYRVDGRFGLGENYGSLIGMQDIRGTSPLRLQTLQDYLGLPQYRMHQLLAVKYVFTDWQQLEVPTTVRAETTLGASKAILHEIDDPFPRAWMAFQVLTSDNQAETLALLAEPTFDPRLAVILPVEPSLSYPAEPPKHTVTIITHEPERIAISVKTPADGILVVSEMDYPGWHATIDGSPIEIVRADGALRAVPLQAGSHLVELTFAPTSVIVGGAISALALAANVFCVATNFSIGRQSASPAGQP